MRFRVEYGIAILILVIIGFNLHHLSGRTIVAPTPRHHSNEAYQKHRSLKNGTLNMDSEQDNVDLGDVLRQQLEVLKQQSELLKVQNELLRNRLAQGTSLRLDANANIDSKGLEIHPGDLHHQQVIAQEAVPSKQDLHAQHNSKLKNPDEHQPAVAVAHAPAPDLKRRSQPADSAKQLSIEVYSSQRLVKISLNAHKIYEYKETKAGKGRGIHALLLHSYTGAVLAQGHFDTFRSDLAFSEFLDQSTEGRILVLAIRDEGSFSLKNETRAKLTKLGSKEAARVDIRDMWSMVVRIGSPDTMQEQRSISKSIHDWAKPATITAILDAKDTSACVWDSQRRAFCDRYGGYGQLCDCHVPSVLPTGGESLPGLKDVPFVMIASSKRPQYLFRSLKTVLQAEGSNRAMIRVYIDGTDNPQVLEVCKLLGIKGIAHSGQGTQSGRISLHYLHTLTNVFKDFPNAPHVIISEEDLAVAPDFFHFFEQTRPLLEQDSSVYVVSAWNDLGYKHTAKDPAMLMRVDTMPGLGWMLKRELFVKELKPNWPTTTGSWNWDVWMRMPERRKGRVSIIPDVSRTFHFGATGLHVSNHFQEAYFSKHALADVKRVELATSNMTSKAYDQYLHSVIGKAEIIDPSSVDPCKYKEAIPRARSPRVVYIQQRTADDYETWIALAQCFEIWDLDARGYYKSTWRLWLNDTPLIIVGSRSPFYKHKPPSIKSFYKAKAPKKPKRQPSHKLFSA